MTIGEETPTRRMHRPGRALRRWAAVGIVLVIVLAGFGVAEELLLNPPNGETTLTIYTYASLFGGNCGSPVFASVFGAFGSAHHAHVVVDCPSTSLVSALVSQKNAPGADVVIGLDELTGPEADAAGVLEPYDPAAAASVPSELVNDLTPDHAVTPYEWGYLGIDYNASFAGRTGDAITRSAFPQFATNSTWARQLLIEDPTIDITGEEFLLWEIAFYENVLHQNWENWWTSVAPYVPVAPDWSTAFTEFTTPPNNPSMVVSYTTDPAYAAANGATGSYNSTVTTWNGSEYGWKTIYGIGIVAGTHHLTLAQEFENWFLEGPVQDQIPLNEWEYPANASTPIPSVFDAALPPGPIEALNDGFTPGEVQANLTGWLNEWQSIENQAS